MGKGGVRGEEREKGGVRGEGRRKPSYFRMNLRFNPKATKFTQPLSDITAIWTAGSNNIMLGTTQSTQYVAHHNRSHPSNEITHWWARQQLNHSHDITQKHTHLCNGATQNKVKDHTTNWCWGQAGHWQVLSPILGIDHSWLVVCSPLES